MGHRVNAVAFRLGLNRLWRNNLYFNGFLSEYFLEEGLSLYFNEFFRKEESRKRGYIYSHVKLSLKSKKIFIEVYTNSYKLINLYEKAKVSKFWGREIKLISINWRRNAVKKSVSYESTLESTLLKDNVLCKRIFITKTKVFKKPTFIDVVDFAIEFWEYTTRRYYFIGVQMDIDCKIWGLEIKRLENLLSASSMVDVENVLKEDIGLIFFNNYKEVYVDFCYLTKSQITTDFIVRYLVFKLENKYRLGELIYPLSEGLRKYVAGVMFKCTGRFTRVQRAQKRVLNVGKVSMSTFLAFIDYGYGMARLRYGACGIKIWVRKKYKKNKRYFPTLFMTSLVSHDWADEDVVKEIRKIFFIRSRKRFINFLHNYIKKNNRAKVAFARKKQWKMRSRKKDVNRRVQIGISMKKNNV